ncbi:MAG: hypothetical protein CL842_04615 [Crocinitomicaceae bacterium]|nr:hypothetical protein [Crocinitomicaceae bacterium]
MLSHATYHIQNRYKQAEKKTDIMKKLFLLHKDKEERKSSPQKQECSFPSLQNSLHSHTHAFLANAQVYNDNFVNLIRNYLNINMVKVTTNKGAKAINLHKNMYNKQLEKLIEKNERENKKYDKV